jgi:hypothetical protein
MNLLSSVKGGEYLYQVANSQLVKDLIKQEVRVPYVRVTYTKSDDGVREVAKCMTFDIVTTY